MNIPIKKNEQGFSHILLVTTFILLVAGITTFVIYRIHTVSQIRSEYELSLGKHTAAESVFNNTYWLGLSLTRFKDAKDGETILRPNLKVSKSTSTSVTIDVTGSTFRQVNPCSYEAWQCPEPVSSFNDVELPASLIAPNTEAKLTIHMESRDIAYKIKNKAYHLYIIDSKDKTVATVPYYPDGVAAAVSIYAGDAVGITSQQTRRNTACEAYSPEKIADILKSNGIGLASAQYPGVETIYPKQVLVTTKVSHVYNGVGDAEATLTGKDSNGCMLVLSGTYY